MPILITYATSRGSTQEVAECIAQRLHEDGFAVDCRPVDRVYSVDKYSAVILGSALQHDHWLLDALKFLDVEAMDLRKRPVWTFSVGMAPVATPRWMSKRMVKKEENNVAGLVKKRLPHVKEHRLFAGRADRTTISFPSSLLYGCVGGRLDDFRNWDEIKRWADAIAKEMALEHV
jgi:menaquinone-dependent protoporphyrinogen oxidase